MSPQVMRGFREPYGSWKMICIFLRMALMLPPSRSLSRVPSNITSPSVGL